MVKEIRVNKFIFDIPPQIIVVYVRLLNVF